MKNQFIIIGLVVVSGVYLMTKSSAQNTRNSAGFGGLKTGSTVFAQNGDAYKVAQNSGSFFSNLLAGGTVNLGNSSQFVQPAPLVDVLTSTAGWSPDKSIGAALFGAGF